MNELKLKQVELLDNLIDMIGDAHKISSSMEREATKYMTTTKEKNEHYKNNSQAFQKALYDSVSILANLCYDLKKELGILNNK